MLADFAQKRGRGFRAFANVNGETSFSFLSEYSCPAAKFFGADLLAFAGPEFAEVVSCRKNFKTAAKIVEK